MSEIRYDLLHNCEVIIAPERLTRPNILKIKEKQKDIKKCPFCKGNENLTPKEICSIKDSSGEWSVRVVPNLYRALSIEADFNSKEQGLYEKMDGFGASEVIIDTPDHELYFDKLDSSQMLKWLICLKSRVNDLKNDIRLTHFFIFKNQGVNSGATLPHSHTQLIATPFTPRNKLALLWHYYNYYKYNGRSIFKDIVDFEVDNSERIVKKSENFISFCPYASGFAFEIIIMPTFDVSYLNDLDDNLLNELSSTLKESLKALRKELGGFDYNLNIIQPPVNKNYENEEFFDKIRKFCKFYIRITPRLYKIGGFEIGSNVLINPVEPERVAKLLRE